MINPLWGLQLSCSSINQPTLSSDEAPHHGQRRENQPIPGKKPRADPRLWRADTYFLINTQDYSSCMNWWKRKERKKKSWSFLEVGVRRRCEGDFQHGKGPVKSPSSSALTLLSQAAFLTLSETPDHCAVAKRCQQNAKFWHGLSLLFVENNSLHLVMSLSIRSLINPLKHSRKKWCRFQDQSDG